MQNEYKKGMLFDDYAAVKACHKSALKNVETAKHLKQFEDEVIDKDALRFGRIFHLALLEPEKLTDLEVFDEQKWIPKSDHPDNKSINEQKREWKQGKIETEEDYYKNADEREAIKIMAKSVLENPLAKSFLSGDGDAECSLFWTDEKTGLKCKTRLDWLRADDIIVEVKTDANPSPEAFGKKVYNMSYHVGAWFNREGFEAVMGRPLKGYVYIVVGKSAPHAVAIYMMNAHDFEHGELDAYPLMKRYQIIKQGGFQDYNQNEDGAYKIIPLETPGYEIRNREYLKNQNEESEESQL